MTPSLILLGGSSCVGKTTVAKALCTKFDLKHQQLNDLPSVSSDPELHLITGEPTQWDLPVEELVNMIARRENALAVHLRLSIQAWQKSASRVLFEWEGVSPEFASDMGTQDGISAAFIIETDRNRMHKTLSERSKSFCILSEQRKQKIVHMNCLYGERLREEAIRYSCPWVTSQPWDSLCDRLEETVTIRQHL